MADDDVTSRLTSPPNSPYLCTCCTDALKNLSHDFNTTSHFTSPGFLEAVANKCFICWRLFQLLDSNSQESFQALARYEHLKGPKGDTGNRVTSLNLGKICANGREVYVRSRLHTDRRWWYWDWETCSDVTPDIEVINQVQVPSFDHLLVKVDMDPEASEVSQWIKSCAGSVDVTAWVETIHLIRQWLQACSSSHTQCIHRAKDTTWFPTRVLDLGPLEPAMPDEITVKIIAREQVVPGSRYVTLSHRWTPLIPKLTSQNLDAWSHHLPVEVLTKTFRDFITVSRLLGFRYAWIDSLCIIQESDHGGSDWSDECLTMDLVYRNSFCNFSADWGTHSDGLFLDRKARQFDFSIVSVKLPNTEDTEDTKDNEKRESSYLLIDKSTWQFEVTNSPINSRGWVLQERFLSPRVLHFCQGEVFFECCEASRSERSRQSLPAVDAVTFEPFKNFGENFVGKSNTAACHRVWNRVPEIYTRCALTFASDKLLAISGIARYLKTFLVDDVYVMGVWASTFTTQMLWRCDGSRIRDNFVGLLDGELEPLSVSAAQTAPTPLRQRQGPTFSWVSADHPVNLSTVIGRDYCEGARLVRYREGHAPSDDESITEDIFDYPHEPMVELKVTGLLRCMRLIDIGRKNLHAVFPHQTRRGRLSYPGPPNSIGALRDAVFLDFPIDPLEIPSIESRLFFYMPWAVAGFNSANHDALNCIVLELANREMGRFRRIGLMRYLSRNPEVVLKHNDGDESLPCWSFDPKTRLHTIYII